jgi:hypothetical protein
MEIADRTIVVLGGSGLVGTAVCRELLGRRPARLVLVSRRKHKGEDLAHSLRAQNPEARTQIIPVCGDVFLRAEWHRDGEVSREDILADAKNRLRLVADVLDPLDEDIIGASLLTQIIRGAVPGLSVTSVIGWRRRFAGLPTCQKALCDQRAPTDRVAGLNHWNRGEGEVPLGSPTRP